MNAYEVALIRLRQLRSAPSVASYEAIDQLEGLRTRLRKHIQLQEARFSDFNGRSPEAVPDPPPAVGPRCHPAESSDGPLHDEDDQAGDALGRGSGSLAT